MLQRFESARSRGTPMMRFVLVRLEDRGRMGTRLCVDETGRDEVELWAWRDI